MCSMCASQASTASLSFTPIDRSAENESGRQFGGRSRRREQVPALLPLLRGLLLEAAVRVLVLDVGDAVAVGVGVERVGAEPLLVDVEQPVAVAVDELLLAAAAAVGVLVFGVEDAVAVGVGVERIGAEPLLVDVEQPVAVAVEERLLVARV